MTQKAATRMPDARGHKRKLVGLLASCAFAWGLVSPASAALVNTATATGFANGQPISASDTVSVDLIDANPTLTVVKTATVNDGGDGTDDPGDTISYSFTVTNGGNVTLNNVVLTDPRVTLSAATLTDSGVGGNSSDGILCPAGMSSAPAIR